MCYPGEQAPGFPSHLAKIRSALVGDMLTLYGHTELTINSVCELRNFLNCLEVTLQWGCPVDILRPSNPASGLMISFVQGVNNLQLIITTNYLSNYINFDN